MPSPPPSPPPRVLPTSLQFRQWLLSCLDEFPQPAPSMANEAKELNAAFVLQCVFYDLDEKGAPVRHSLSPYAVQGRSLAAEYCCSGRVAGWVACTSLDLAVATLCCVVLCCDPVLCCVVLCCVVFLDPVADHRINNRKRLLQLLDVVRKNSLLQLPL